MKRWAFVAAAILSVTLSRPAWALFGIGDIVFDPSNFAKAIEQLLEMERQYTQLVETYQMVRNQYDHMQRMAQRVPVHMEARYRALVTRWKGSSATNTYGTTGPWINGINTGSNVEAGYQGAALPLNDYGAALANVPTDQQPRIKTTFATVELTDGANIAAMDTIGRLRSNATGVESAIRGLEEDSLSSDPEMNTEMAVLNKINAANVIALRASQDTNKVLVALAEQQILEAKRQRDAEVQAINQDIRFRAEGKAAIFAQAGDASAAMRAWRMP
jgi:type IV secretion system protein TrbJ